MPRKETVTVNGKPLSQYIEEMEEEEEANRQGLKGMEIAHHRKEVIREQNKVLYHDSHLKVVPKTRFKKYQKCSKVIHLSNDQIRKEYGIMSKPYTTVAQNVICAIVEKGPIQIKEIAKEIERARSSVWNVINRLEFCIPEENFKVQIGKQLGRPKSYKIEGLTTEQASEMFFDSKYKARYGNKKLKPKKKIKRRKEKTPRMLSIDRVSDIFEKMSKEFKRIENEAKEKFDVNLKISGKIEFLFGFVEREEL